MRGRRQTRCTRRARRNRRSSPRCDVCTKIGKSPGTEATPQSFGMARFVPSTTPPLCDTAQLGPPRLRVGVKCLAPWATARVTSQLEALWLRCMTSEVSTRRSDSMPAQDI